LTEECPRDTTKEKRKGALTISTQPQPLEDLCRRIRGEYIEMPGLRLTATQAERLWGLDRAACETVLSALVDVEFLILYVVNAEGLIQHIKGAVWVPEAPKR